MDNESATVRLSPSQKAYREDPQGFLGRLGERAATLFESGYRVRPGEHDHVFVVTAPAPRKGSRAAGSGEPGEYRVHARARTCDCPFFARQQAGERLGAAGDDEDDSVVPCKHLAGLPALVRKTRQEFYEQGRVGAFCALSVHWLKHLAALRRERIREAATVATETAAARNFDTPTAGGVAAGFEHSREENGAWRK